jgi:hypothetical protein
MSPYIEILAIDLYEATGQFDWVDAVEPAKDDFRKKARETLAKLRDPSDLMKVAGGLKCEAMMFEDDPEFSGVIFNDLAVIFRTMIDAELGEARP